MSAEYRSAIGALKLPASQAEPFVLGYRPELDGLRALAVLAVMLFHAHVPLIPGGYIGVDLFFVLSGFLITTILCAEMRASGRVLLGRFYLRRALRLVPALLLLLVCYAGVVLAVAPTPRPLLEDGLIALLYISNWVRAFEPSRPDYLAHTWSLAIEEQFYLAWPLLLILLTRAIPSPRGVLRLILVGAAAALALRVALVAGGASPFRVYHGLDTRADALLVGCALGFGLAQGLIRPAIPQVLRMPLLVGAAAGLLALAATARWDAPLMLTVGYSLAALLSGLLLLVCLSGPDDTLCRALRWQPLSWVGRRSYGLYLWHYPIMRLLFTQTDSWPVVALGGIALSLVAAGLSYALVERRFLALKDVLAAGGTARER